MHELLEIILEDIVQMSEEGLYPPHVCQQILDQIEAREYEFSEMCSGRQDSRFQSKRTGH
jgi:hypothetical protein